jgi:hypothetical protein
MRRLLGIWLFALLYQCSAAIAAPQVGWWWNPNESGRGFFVESQNGATFIGAYFYDDDGHAMWLVAGGQNADSYNYAGPLYALKNGQTLFGSYVAPVGPETVGQMEVHFSDDTHGTFTWPGGTVAIERQIFGGTDAPFQPFNGWWWNPDESGSGYSLELQGDKLFIVGFMYDDAGRPVWYFSAGPMSSPTTYHGDVLQFANGQTMGGPYHPPSGYTTPATLDVEFTATDAATLMFTEAAGTSDMVRKTLPRSRWDFIRPQFPKEGIWIPPIAFTGFLTIDSKVHIDRGDGFVDDLHAVFQITATLSDSEAPTGPGTTGIYDTTDGELVATYDSFSTLPDDSICVGHGERILHLSGLYGGPSPDPYLLLTARADRFYQLLEELKPGVLRVDISGICTTSDGESVGLVTAATNGTGKLNYEGTIVGDGFHGGSIQTTGPEDGITTTITRNWSFTAVRK